MDKKLFRKTYQFICTDCGQFAHTLNEYCEKCGTQNSVHSASKKEYQTYNK